ncbi:hypothetical protein SORBI_3010G142132 [Sorghum bicolor]|uniref:Uncharacterized protein n=1 Tax=Sorghum bicolor TaxID=4558 RepID=A0A1W0VSY7_SORBI|nr:hypothetical protein SORBI_3010G142132 [Sorghum bicolor]
MVAAQRRVKVESLSRTPDNKGKMQKIKGQSSTPSPALMNPSSCNKGKEKVPYDSDLEEEDELVDRVGFLTEEANKTATKKVLRRVDKTSTGVDQAFDTLFINIKYSVLDSLAHNKKVASFQKIIELFDGVKADAREQVMSPAKKMCTDLDEVLETLFVDVKYGLVKHEQNKHKKRKKSKKSK